MSNHSYLAQFGINGNLTNHHLDPCPVSGRCAGLRRRGTHPPHRPDPPGDEEVTEPRTRCLYTIPNGVPYLDQSTFDRLHQTAAGLAHAAQQVDGIGGTERADDNTIEDLLFSARRTAALSQDALNLAVDAARDHGWSWDRIGREFEISRQAAQQRFGGGK